MHKNKPALAVRAIYALEISGVCNLESSCVQCPMSERPRYRKRGLMTPETFERAFYWIQRLGTKDPLDLNVFGEPLLHPQFIDFAKRLSSIGAPLTFSTNATFLDEKMANRLAEIPWKWISVSPWDEPAKERAVKLLLERGINVGLPPGATHDWAGTAKGGVKDQHFHNGCEFLDVGFGVIRWNGDMTTCCLTDLESGVIGHINQEPGEVFVRGYDICAKCHLRRK